MKIKEQSGVILILSLWFLAGLSLLSLGFAHRTRLEVKVTGFYKDKIYALHLAKAGVNRAIVSIENDENSYDSLNEPWHVHPTWEEEGWFGDKNSDEKKREVIYEVVDEESKININTAPKELLMGLPGIDETIASAIIDWRDEDNLPQEGGAENDYYQSLDPPYNCKNAPFDLVSELLAVKGITPELFFGEDANGNGLLDPNENDGSLTPPNDNMDGELQIGINDLVTVYGEGLINLNTASLQVLVAIPGLREETARAIIDYRSGPDGEEGTEDDEPFTKLEDLEKLPELNRYEYHQLRSMGTVSSNYFTISSHAYLRGGKVHKKVTAIVDRSKPSLRILSWRED